MSVNYKQIEWIVGAVNRLVRKTAPRQDHNLPILSLELSFGNKLKDDDGAAVRDPVTQAELWNTLADKTYEAKVFDVMEFSAVADPVAIAQELIATHGAMVAAGVPVAQANFFMFDAMQATPLEEFAKWMFSAGRWKV